MAEQRIDDGEVALPERRTAWSDRLALPGCL